MFFEALKKETNLLKEYIYYYCYILLRNQISFYFN